MIKRLFDIIFSFFGIILLLPVLIIIAILIKIESKGSVFYIQKRVGRHNKDFNIYKYRTMFVDSEKKGLLTIGDRDPRVTSIGYVLRKFKLDEIPQLINVFIGNMSFVGPRPEVRKYLNHYSKDDLLILSVKPGITDYASIYFRNEAELLKATNNPEKLYVETILPKKIALNKIYINKNNVVIDFKIIVKTLLTIIK
ncbi:sugar transferase [Formosa maritima]|uniref:Sugar transferase n=1 Tax=Formosa maritima TaxID=2592046 RepID=A0A5D0GIT9_9FLAO|nr:sugar transferase [Formosa maritima]TYA58935.1 sugar transferase [Formosa maritima]